MFTTREQEAIVTMLAEGSPVWFVAAVTKSDRHHVYAVGTRYGYPNRTTLRLNLQRGVFADAALPGAA